MEDDFQPPKSFGLIAAIFEGGLAVLAVALGWLLGVDPLDTLRFSAADLGWGLLATGPPLGVLWICLKWPIGPLARLMQVVDELLIPLFRNCPTTEILVICLLAGLGEEMLFRGVVQQAVADWVGGPAGVWSGLAASAALFALVHRITNTYALLAGLIGLYLGWIWLLSGNLLVPITAHTAYDFVVLVYLVRVRKPLAA